jgi:hypothetical protein
VRPLKADARQLIDPDAILAGTLSPKSFEPVARQGPQRVKRQRGVQDGKPPFGLLLESLEHPDKVTLIKPLGLFVPVSGDHLAEDHSLPMQTHIHHMSSVNYWLCHAPLFLTPVPCSA